MLHCSTSPARRRHSFWAPELAATEYWHVHTSVRRYPSYTTKDVAGEANTTSVWVRMVVLPVTTDITCPLIHFLSIPRWSSNDECTLRSWWLIREITYAQLTAENQHECNYHSLYKTQRHLRQASNHRTDVKEQAFLVPLLMTDGNSVLVGWRTDNIQSWRGLVVTRWSRSTQLLNVRPG